MDMYECGRARQSPMRLAEPNALVGSVIPPPWQSRTLAGLFFFRPALSFKKFGGSSIRKEVKGLRRFG